MNAGGDSSAVPVPPRRGSGRRIFKQLATAGCLVLVTPEGQAADPVGYKLTIAPTGDAGIDARLHTASSLESLRTSAPVGSFALLARARADVTRFQTVLQSDGYYAATVTLRIDGRALDDPGLAATLDALPTGASVPVDAAITRGPEFHLGHVALTGTVPPAGQAALKLAPGDPARAADVLAARQRVRDALEAQGYALAQVDAPVATLDPAAHALDVSFAVRSGPRVDLGAVDITGLDHLDAEYVRRRLGLAPGERFSPATLEAARARLAASGAVAGVRIVPGEAVDASGRLPVQVVVTERPLHAVALTAAYSTDQGGSVTASWTHRDLWGGGEQLTLAAAATELGGTASRQPGYDVSATLVVPDWQRLDQSLTFRLEGVKESLQAYDRTALIAAATLSRKLSQELTVSLGVAAEEAHFVQEQVARDYSLLQLPIGAAWDSSDSLFDPTRGLRAKATVTPSVSLGTHGSATQEFVIAQGSVAYYLDAGRLLGGTPGRSILATRALLGSVSGATLFDIPPDQRFYAGGGGTIRGYRFQSVGPRFPIDNHPTGGTSLDVATVEYRQRVFGSFGFAAFVDAGQVGTGSVPFNGRLDVGAGVGVRYFTAIGPIRVDVAVPLVHEPKADAVEFYIGIGQAF